MSTTETPTRESVLSLRGLSKTFPGTVALDDVSLDVAPGEVHALVGQNGSGKSTLIKVLAGYHTAEPGLDARLNDQPIDLTTGGHERLRFVHQDLGLFLELSAVDNLALRGHFINGRTGLVDWRAQAALTRDLLARFDLDLDVHRPLAEATPVQRVVVAIAAALAYWAEGPGVLVLDEPTAVLPPHDVEVLLELVMSLRSRGTSVLYVSHRLDEVFRVADRVTVLRGGRLVQTRDVAGLTSQTLAELMVGSEVDAGYRAGLQTDEQAPVVLSARGLRADFLDDVEVSIRAGEVLGVAGLPGSGRSDLPYALAGALPRIRGEVRQGDGAWVPASSARDMDIPLVPADRGREAVVQEFSVGENMTVSVLDRFTAGGWLRRGKERSFVSDWMARTEVKASSLDASITSLSGGNQQKVVMARCLARDPRVLVLCEPTAGVDVGTRQAIYEFIAARAREGLAVVVSSTDTGDLLALCTRVLVMSNGRVVREIQSSDITEETLLHAMEETDQR
jgi:ribose transport system ATP-binding protein